MSYLYSSFSCLMTNFPSLTRFVPDGCQHWTLALPRTCQYPQALRYSSLLGLVVELPYLPRGSLRVLFKVCSSGIDLFSFIPILYFSSSYNSPPKPHFLFFLGKGGFGIRGESLGTFLVCSHVETSFQLIGTRF